MKPVFFEKIPVIAPLPAIYRRLGYRRRITRLNAEGRREIERYLDEAQDLIAPKGTALRLPCRIEPPGRVVLGETTVFASRDLARFLKNSGEALLMGATGGAAIMEAIQAEMAGGDATRGVTLDAAASEITDAALDWIMSYFRQTLRREGKTLLTGRFSPGYGDFVLENQLLVHRLLPMEQLGVTLTKTCLMVPEKSVTALTGIVSL
ncbi:MAG: methionine synthase [Pseudomonadota bacterium]|nr:methionine synthase [Pseudomonadota bacterium]